MDYALNESEKRKWVKRIKQSTALASDAARKFATHATTGQKIAAASTIGGATYYGAKRGIKAWKRKDKEDRLKRTIKHAAKGAFGGAIGGAITGHAVGKSVDYIVGEDNPRHYESVENAVSDIATNQTSITDAIEELLERKGLLNFLDPRRRKGSIAIGAGLGAIKGAIHAKQSATGVKKADRRSMLKNVAHGVATGAVGGYVGDVADRAIRLSSKKLNRRWSN
jgi:hypothetical protein